MRAEDGLVKTFAKCFRLLAKFNAGLSDGFFVDLISKESENLLSGYIEFLKIRGDMIAKTNYVAQVCILQHQDVAKCRDIVQHASRVAQYHQELISRISSLLLLLDILKHLSLTDTITPLLLERELLKLTLLLLNDSKQFSVMAARAGGSQKNQQRNKNLKLPVDNLSELNSDRTKPQELGAMQRQVAEFVRSKERVQNIEVFGQFADITRRTLKRKLSELVKAGVIKRLALGKKVFYTYLSAG